MEKKIPLPGDLVKDRVTGLEGIVTARTQFMNMCDRYTVQPRVKSQGEEKIPNAYHIDVSDLVIVQENAAGLSPEERARWGTAPENGGPPEAIEREPAQR